jgi:hypothetical protein
MLVNESGFKQNTSPTFEKIGATTCLPAGMSIELPMSERQKIQRVAQVIGF